MTHLYLKQLNKLQLPLNSCQQLAELHFYKGHYEASNTPSYDLLAGMRVKSRLAAAKATAQHPPSLNYQQALFHLDTLVEQNHQSLTAKHVKQLHQQLSPQGGHWRCVKLLVPRRDKPEQNILIATHKEGMDTVLSQLLQELKLALHQGTDPLIVIPLFCFEFIRLFPFLDGNWRLMLLLSRYLLTTHGHKVAQYIDLESECCATKRTFYRTLYLCDQDNNPQAWLSYWWVLIKRLYLRFDRQVQHANILPGRGAKTALINRYVHQQQQAFKFQDVCAAFPTISRDQVRLALRKLRDQEIIQAKGRGPSALWIKTRCRAN